MLRMPRDGLVLWVPLALPVLPIRSGQGTGKASGTQEALSEETYASRNGKWGITKLCRYLGNLGRLPPESV